MTYYKYDKKKDRLFHILIIPFIILFIIFGFSQEIKDWRNEKSCEAILKKIKQSTIESIDIYAGSKSYSTDTLNFICKLTNKHAISEFKKDLVASKPFYSKMTVAVNEKTFILNLRDGQSYECVLIDTEKHGVNIELSSYTDESSCDARNDNLKKFTTITTTDLP